MWGTVQDLLQQQAQLPDEEDPKVLLPSCSTNSCPYFCSSYPDCEQVVRLAAAMLIFFIVCILLLLVYLVCRSVARVQTVLQITAQNIMMVDKNSWND